MLLKTHHCSGGWMVYWKPVKLEEKGLWGPPHLPRSAILLRTPRNPPAPLGGKQTHLSGYTLEQQSWKVALCPQEWMWAPPHQLCATASLPRNRQRCPSSFSVRGPNLNLVQKGNFLDFLLPPRRPTRPPALELRLRDCQGRPELSHVGGGGGWFLRDITCIFVPF